MKEDIKKRDSTHCGKQQVALASPSAIAYPMVAPMVLLRLGRSHSALSSYFPIDTKGDGPPSASMRHSITAPCTAVEVVALAALVKEDIRLSPSGKAAGGG